MIENDIFNFLKSDATLLGLLGTTAAAPGIYPDKAPQGDDNNPINPPYIVYSNDIGSTADEIVGEDRIQLTIVGANKAQVDGIRDRIKTILDIQDHNGTNYTIKVITSSTYYIYYSRLTSGFSLFNKESGPDTTEKVYSMFFNIEYQKK